MESNILDSIDMRQIGKALQEARKRRGMTQEAAAEVLGLPGRRSRRSRKVSDASKRVS